MLTLCHHSRTTPAVSARLWIQLWFWNPGIRAILIRGCSPLSQGSRLPSRVGLSPALEARGLPACPYAFPRRERFGAQVSPPQNPHTLHNPSRPKRGKAGVAPFGMDRPRGSADGRKRTLPLACKAGGMPKGVPRDNSGFASEHPTVFRSCAARMKPAASISPARVRRMGGETMGPEVASFSRAEG